MEDNAFGKVDSSRASVTNSTPGSPVSIASSTQTSAIANSFNNMSSSSDEQPSDVQIPLRRSTRDKKPNPKYAAHIYNSCSFALYVTEPTSYEEVVAVPKWQEAMIEEMRAIEHNQKHGSWGIYQKANLLFDSNGCLD